MVTCFMSVPCCGCVSQTERLTNCSILLNVRVMEAINGSELIAVTHLAPCYRVLPFTTCSEDLVLSRCWICCLVCGQMSSHWIVENGMALSALLSVHFLSMQQLALLSMLGRSLSHSTRLLPLEWDLRCETRSPVAFTVGLWKRRVCVHVCVSLFVY